MNSELPFLSRQFPSAETLLLIPYCHHRLQWSQLTARSRSRQSIMGSELIHFDRLSILTGFMGYPQMLTLLAGIESWREKRLCFLGTSGVLGDQPLPDLVTVSSVSITPELRPLFPDFTLDMLPLNDLPAEALVTVDLPHRETPQWLEATIRTGIKRVEMELYFLRLFYGRPFWALLVGTDRQCPGEPAERAEYSKIRETFNEGFQQLMEVIDEA